MLAAISVRKQRFQARAGSQQPDEGSAVLFKVKSGMEVGGFETGIFRRREDPPCSLPPGPYLQFDQERLHRAYPAAGGLPREQRLMKVRIAPIQTPGKVRCGTQLRRGGVSLEILQNPAGTPRLEIDFERSAEEKIGRPNALALNVDSVIGLCGIAGGATGVTPRAEIRPAGIGSQQVRANESRSARRKIDPEEIGLRIVPSREDRSVLVAPAGRNDQRALDRSGNRAADVQIETDAAYAFTPPCLPRVLQGRGCRPLA